VAGGDLLAVACGPQRAVGDEDVIKRIRFATRRADLAPADFPSAWRATGCAAAVAPPGVRPDRIAVCTSLPEVIAGPKHDGVGIEWFTDVGHLSRFEEWLQGPPGEAVADCLDRALQIPGSPVLVADEVVMRGADWLAARWRQPGDKIKHMAIARRAPQLTPAQFSERWRGRAGTVGSAQGRVVTIPDEARGLAYVQNHTRHALSGPWAYDAVNEVYFDSIDALLVRVAWFEGNLRGQSERDLVSESWFIACQEEVL
jgi:hypothetical protein